MNIRDLHMKMLLWEDKREELDELEAEIRAGILELQETQKVGHVVASYSGGRRTFEYERPVLAARAKAIEEMDEARIQDINAAMQMHTTTKVTVNFRNVCETLQLTREEVDKSDPSVTLKLVR